MSLVAGAIAALVIFIAGLVSDARIGTILLRCIGGFFVAGIVVWLVAMVLEAKQIVGFDSNIEMPEPSKGGESLEDDETPRAGAKGGEEEAGPSAKDESPSKPDDEKREAEGFKPLADGVRRMETPSES